MSTTRVLCVDDDQVVLKSIEALLLYSGFEVAAVASVPEALELISKQTFDVLLTDLNIGQAGDGFTVVSAMRRVQPDACTFILTGYPDIEPAIQAIRSQVDDYFSKPLDVQEFLTAITQARSGNRSTIKKKRPIKVCELLRGSIARICRSWLEEVLRDPELGAMPLTEEERLDHLPEWLEELAAQMEHHDQGLSGKAAEAARRHGKTRYQQGYTIPQILFETRVLQQVLSSTIQKELLSLELSTLLPDAFTIGEMLEAALELSIHAYQGQVPHSLQSSFSLLYKSPYLGVAIADETRIIDANDALLHMIKSTRQQLLNGEVSWIEMTPEKFRPSDLNAVEQLREFGVCVPFEKEFNLRDGSTLPFLIGAVRLSIEPFQWSVYMIDLTEQRRLHAAEQKVREWESRHLLINRLAHEINNPLAGLMFSVHLLETHPEITSDMQGLVRDAAEMLDRVNEVVKMVLVESGTKGA